MDNRSPGQVTAELMKSHVLTEKQLKFYKQINSYAPFVHGTTFYNEEIIDKQGLKPRGQGTGQWESSALELKSKHDRVYFASIKENFEKAWEAMENATNDKYGEGRFYVLTKIRPEWLLNVTIDEDCKDCFTSVDSLRMIGSFGIKRRVPRKYLKKMTTKEFYEYVRNYIPKYENVTWKEFIMKRITDNHNKEVLEWYKKHQPDLFEPYEGDVK